MHSNNKIKYIILLCLIIINAHIFSDGFIVIPEPEVLPITNTPFPLEVKYHHVNVDIYELTAVTHIEQEFYNPSNQTLEGYYIFPVPKNAVIKKFSMYINGKETFAELLEANKAKNIYEEIVRNLRDPALLEYSGQALFKVRIFPIEPHSTKKIKISYNEILNKDNGTIEYLYPLNTEKFSAKPLKNVGINIQIKSNDTIKNIYCTTHEVNILKNENSATVAFEEYNVKPNRDFILHYNSSTSRIGASLLTFNKADEDGYFFLNISPGIDEKDNEVIKKDVTFVLDVSGSMDGEKMEQAKKALTFCINNLNKDDRFNIIRFSTEAEALFEKLNNTVPDNIKKAKTFINELKAIGGTNIDEALKLALSAETDSSRPHMIIFITDGKPTIGETNEDILIKNLEKANTKNTRIFTFGIGYELNIHLLDKITELTKAFRTYIHPEEDMEVKISNFYNKVQSPILTDIEIQTDGNIKLLKTYPKQLPDLFKGSSITILGRYKSSKKESKVIVKGNIGKNTKKYEYTFSFPEKSLEHDFIPQLWAARRIGYLLDQIRLHGENKELVTEITELAKKHGIITPYTSYLILEDEKSRVTRREIDEDDQILSNILPAPSIIKKRYKSDFEGMKEKSGESSIQASEDFQKLNMASNFDKVSKPEERLDYKDHEGNIKNLAEQVINIQGKAIYKIDNYWIDSEVQSQNKNKKVKIQFASKKYFELLKSNPELTQLLYLGKNIKFVSNNITYEIYE